ncbi:S-adenosyl-L-methionine-dependent methyltransferases superfamily protein [Rhynchospora pubera]|uniref:S-adenosyl-L-methionine-dependent methyltransferases superfamily protein n=1 Tax=Rhynchospora pubera TaxID=906938 RepID=A0AAV8ETR4_9POAL|nr:S-adenosyl-L-methionine-dependent methyltransferases superfamily protein [Rhynchospora pubera]
MGSVSLKIGHGSARFNRATLCSSVVHLLMLSSIVTTNLFALYAFTYSPPSPSDTTTSSSSLSHSSKNMSVISEHVALILREIEESQRRLRQIERELSGFDFFDLSRPNLPPELHTFLTSHPLPLGRDARSGLTHMLSSVSHQCGKSPSALDLLTQYMSYKAYSNCPSVDPGITQKLISKACEPLPRRRCLTKLSGKRGGRLPFPQSLWNPSPLPSTGTSGIDKRMWVKPRWKNDFLIDDVLELAGSGGVKIGFDIGGGAGNFAARMAERNVMVVTSVLNSGGKPMNELVAARGLFPIQITPSQHFPFYDGIFDLVHISSALDEGGAPAMGMAHRPEALEFLLFDIDRIIRTNGLLWIDNYHCSSDERGQDLIRIIEKFRYKKLKWVLGEKEVNNDGHMQVYLSAILQKPNRG